MVAVGVGCRANCGVEDVEGAILDALRASARDLAEIHAIYAPDFKRDEPCLSSVAGKLGKPLIFLPLSDLERYSNLAITSSPLIMQRFGLPSIAETAALAGAIASAPPGVGVRLLGPRTIRGGATCALAEDLASAAT